MLRRSTYVEHAHHAKDTIRNLKNKKRIKFAYHDEDISLIEGIYARGDRKISKVILDVYNAGGIFDAWNEYFSMERYNDAFVKEGIDPEWYIYRERPIDEVFPWSVIDAGVSDTFLKNEWKKAMEGTPSPNCRMKCQGCGAASFGGGVCFEN